MRIRRPGRRRTALFALWLPVLFLLVTWQAAAEGPVRRGDERLGRAMHGALPRGAAEFFADLGSAAVAVPVLVLVLGCAALMDRGRTVRRLWPLLCAGLAMAAVPALVAPLKTLIARPGPPGAGPCDCYPSGHAATAAVAYGAAVLLLVPWLRGRGARRLVTAGVLLLNGCVGVGLVVRGYHWPLDVVGSWLLSALLLGPPAAMRSEGRAGEPVSRRGSAAGDVGR